MCLGLGKGFLDLTLKTKLTKERIDKLDFIRIKNFFFCIKGNYQESKKITYKMGQYLQIIYFIRN